MRFLLFIGLFAISQMAKSQNCGSVPVLPPSWSVEDVAPYTYQKRGPIDTIGVAVHILSDDLNPVTQEDVQLELDVVNSHFAPVGVYFFICSIGEVYGKGTFNVDEIAEVNKRMHIDNRINLYIPPRLTTVGSFKICGQGMFPWENEPEDRYIVVSRKCMDNGTTMVHEFGHYYGLLHTHETSFGVERADGSNCNSAGDQICDTPADPLLGPGHIRGCDYIGALRDPDGNFYDPDPSFIMSYAPKECRNRFSLQQYAVMRYYAQSEHQRYTSSCKELPDIFVDVERIRDSVRFDEELSFFVHMVNTLQKDTVIDLSVQISSDRVIFDEVIYREQINASEGDGNILRNISVRIPPALPEGRFFVRVFADAEQLHEEGNEFNNFVTSEFILDNSAINSGTLFPNPASDYIHYFYEADYPGNHVMRIYSASGQIVRNYEVSSDTRNVFSNIDVSDLSPGVYVLTHYLLNEQRSENTRFVISR